MGDHTALGQDPHFTLLPIPHKATSFLIGVHNSTLARSVAQATCLTPLSSSLAKTPHQPPLGSVDGVLWGMSDFGGRETELTGGTPKPPLFYVGLTGALILTVPQQTYPVVLLYCLELLSWPEEGFFPFGLPHCDR